MPCRFHGFLFLSLSAILMLNVLATKEKIISSVDPAEFYRMAFPKWDGHSNVSCPFHKDTKPSLSINPKTGQARCHSTNCPEGRFASIVHFYERWRHLDEERAVVQLARKYDITPEEEKKLLLSPKRIHFWCERLRDNQPIRKIFKNLRGIEDEVIDEYKIGYDPAMSRITLPCYNHNKKLVNVRRYELLRREDSTKRPKMLSITNSSGGDSTVLYPEWKIDHKSEEILLFGGELDCLVAKQAGFNAVSSVSGEATWHDSWLSFFKGRKVWLLLDWDAGGNKAAKKIKEILTSHDIAATRVMLPFTRPHLHKDFTEWVVVEGHAARDLRLYLKESTTVGLEEDLEEAVSAPLAELLTQKWQNKKFKTHCIVAGKGERPYLVPKKARCTCSGKCGGCVVCMSEDATLEMVFQPHDRRILHFMDRTDHSLKLEIRSMLGIPKQCSTKIEILECMNLHTLSLIPDANYIEGSYTMQTAFYTGEPIEANRPYTMVGRVVSDPTTQELTILINTATPTQSIIDNFELTSEVRKSLSVFRPKEDIREMVWEKLNDIAHDHAECRTRIVDRIDHHLLIMLTYHSIVEFKFNNSMIRGWINALAVGDTASGKSQCAKDLRKLYRAGDWVSGENCTYMGLIGGLFQIRGNQWAIRWGKIPLNDRKLVTLEELTGLSKEVISKMTDVRSSGMCHIDKGPHSTQTTARTRFIALSNPRTGRNLHNYPTGVDAIVDLIGNMEDIRRFDIIITLRNFEVKGTRIMEMERKPRTQSKYNDAACQSLLAWAWSLKSEDVTITPEAEELCRTSAYEMGNFYHAYVPIFKAEDGRHKIARLAVAIAAQVFSEKDAKLIVKPCHVHAAIQYLDTTYTKESMGYDVFSELRHHKDELGSEKVIANCFAQIDETNYQKTLGQMLTSVYITVEELSAMSGLEEMEAKRIVHTLFRERGLVKEANLGWSVTPPLRAWLQKKHKPDE